jgi:hypothetical protein
LSRDFEGMRWSGCEVKVPLKRAAQEGVPAQ